MWQRAGKEGFGGPAAQHTFAGASILADDSHVQAGICSKGFRISELIFCGRLGAWSIRWVGLEKKVTPRERGLHCGCQPSSRDSRVRAVIAFSASVGGRKRQWSIRAITGGGTVTDDFRSEICLVSFSMWSFQNVGYWREFHCSQAQADDEATFGL